MMLWNVLAPSFDHRIMPYPNSFASQCEESDLIQADSFLMQDSSSKERYDDNVAAITLVCVKLSGAQVNLKKEK